MEPKLHHAIIVSSKIPERFCAALATAQRIFGECVSPAVPGRVDACFSFLIAPDGSKQRWPESDYGDERRQQFIDWLDSQRHEDGAYTVDWVEVQYGDGYAETKVTRDSDAR